MLLVVFFLSLLVVLVVGGGDFPSVSIYNKLSEQVEKDPMPLFDFGTDLDHIIQLNIHSDLETKIIFEQYVEKLIGYYYQEYVNRVQTTNNVQRMKVTQAIIVKEFDTAVKAALPKSKQDEWVTLPFLQQLLEDIDSYIERKLESSNLHANEDNAVYANGEAHSNHPWLQPAKLKSAMRWLLSQSLLLLINFAQYEWFRRQNVRAVERRLAEVPEFPLL